MNQGIERPGALTPWQTINQILEVDERFERLTSEGIGYLLAPKTTSKLSVVLYALKELSVFYTLDQPGDTLTNSSKVLISGRAFNQICFLSDGCLEVGAGCSLSLIHNCLCELGYELGLEEMAFQGRRSIGELLLTGRMPGVVIKQENLIERLLSVELIKPDGGILKWGRNLRSACAGPLSPDLIWGLQNLPAILVSATLKTDLIPSKRLYLSWSFSHSQELWPIFHLLQSFTSTWERLDCLLSGNGNEKAFILAQISGEKEEISAFKKSCPYFQEASQENKGLLFKNFFHQKKYHFQMTAEKAQLERLSANDYYWYQGVIDQGWHISLTPLSSNPVPLPQPFWQTRLFTCLAEEKIKHG